MPAGRPTKYKPEYADQASKLCRLGATDAELADFFQVSVSTVTLWKVEHPEFSASLKMGKEEADARVEASLYSRAMGYTHDETDIRVIDGKIVMTPMLKSYPPDTTAAIFWLKNRKPKEWRDVKATELSGPNGLPMEVTEVANSELDRRISELEAKRKP